MADTRTNVNGCSREQFRNSKNFKNSLGRQNLRKKRENGQQGHLSQSSSIDNGESAVNHEGMTPPESLSSVSLDEDTTSISPSPQTGSGSLATPPTTESLKGEEQKTNGQTSPEKKPAVTRNLGRLEKDLGRQISTLNRCNPQISKWFDDAEQLLTASYDKIIETATLKREKLLGEIREARKSSETLLHNRKTEADDLKRRISECEVLDDDRMETLRADLKQFVSEKECDISLGDPHRLQYEASHLEDLLKSIDTLISVCPPSDPYISRSSTVVPAAPTPPEVGTAPGEPPSPKHSPPRSQNHHKLDQRRKSEHDNHADLQEHPPVNNKPLLGECPAAYQPAPISSQLPTNLQCPAMGHNMLVVEHHPHSAMQVPLNRPYTPNYLFQPMPVLQPMHHNPALINPPPIDPIPPAHNPQQRSQPPKESSPPLSAESPVTTVPNDEYQIDHQGNRQSHMPNNHTAGIRYNQNNHNYNGAHHVGGGNAGGGNNYIRRQYPNNQRGAGVTGNGRGGAHRPYYGNSQRYGQGGQMPQQEQPQNYNGYSQNANRNNYYAGQNGYQENYRSYGNRGNGGQNFRRSSSTRGRNNQSISAHE